MRIVFLMLLIVLEVFSDVNLTIYTPKFHDGSMTHVVTSKDSTLLATAGKDGTVRFWDINKKRYIKSIYIGEEVNQIVLNKKNNLLATISGYTYLKLWNIKTGKLIRELHKVKPPSFGTLGVDVSDDGRYLIFVNKPNIYVYDLETYTLIETKSIVGHDMGGDAKVVFFQNDKELLVYGSGFDNVYLYSFDEGKIVLEESYIGTKAVMSDDGRYMAINNCVSSCLDNYRKANIVIYDLQTQKKLRVLRGFEKFNIKSLNFIPKTHNMLIEQENFTEEYNVETGERVKKFKNNGMWDFLEHSTIYINGLGSNLITGIDYYSNKEVFRFEKSMKKYKRVFIYKEFFYALTFEGKIIRWNLKTGSFESFYDNKHVYSVSNFGHRVVLKLENSIIIYDLEKKQAVKDIQAENKSGLRDIFFVDEKTICLAYKAYMVVYNFEKNKIIETLYTYYSEQAQKIDNSLFVANQSNIYQFEFKTMKLIDFYTVNSDALVKFSLSSNGLVAYQVYLDSIKLYDYKQSRVRNVFPDSNHNTVMVLSEDNKQIAYSAKNNVIKIWNIKERKLIGKTKSFSSEVKFLNYYDEDRYLVVTLDNGEINIYDTRSYVKLASLIQYDKEWLTLTPGGYFAGSQKALSNLLVRTGGLETTDFRQFYDHFFRPDLVKLKLSGDEEAFQKATNGLTYQDALKNPPPKLSFKTIDNKDTKTSGFEYKAVDTKKEKVNLTFNVNEHDGGGVGLIRVYQEGKLIQTIGEGKVNKQSANVDAILEQEKLDSTVKENQRQYIASLSKSISSDANLSIEDTIATVAPKTTTNQSGTYNLEIELKSGKNDISIEAFNKTNTVTSYRENITINADIPKQKPKLYAIVAGVNEFEVPSVNNLKYSENDAKDIKEAAEQKMKTVFDDVEVLYLTGKEVTKENILKAAQNISKKAKLDDTVLFYISTHGRAAKGKLYLVPYNNKSVKNWIDFEQTFQAVQSIKALNQIFIIDACESGKANDIVSSVYDSRASVLAKSSGVHMLLATTKGTSAFEHPDPSIKNGVFTHRILEAMKDNTTDANKDSLISILELSKKLKEPTNNADYQYPVIRNVGKDVELERVGE